MRLSEAVAVLAEAGIEDARWEARRIFCDIGGLSDLSLVGKDAECDCPAVLDAISRRAKREPLQYILGYADFYRERYKVTPDVLIPRQDTEMLVDYAVHNLARGARFLDLCTGSGCVAISTLKNTIDTGAVLVDISECALAVAKENAAAIGVLHRAELNCLDVTAQKIEGKFDAVLSNPPYVTEKSYEALMPEIYFEPKIAFVGGGDDGASFYEIITALYRDSLTDGGFIAFEIGYDQKNVIESIAKRHQMSCEVQKDLGGNWRLAILKNEK